MTLAGCAPTAEAPEVTPETAVTIVPQPEVRGDAALPRLDAEAALASTPRLPLRASETQLELLDINLDLDPTDEQLLVVAEGSGPIRLVFVDYDEIRQEWRRTTEYPTRATNRRAFRVEPEDIIGDYSLEVAFHGLDSEGLATLDVLRRTLDQSGAVQFTPIFSLSADRSIVVDRHRRPQSYQFGQKYDEGFPIVVERRDLERENDILRETYHWIYQARRYVKSLEERIPGDELMQQQLRQLFSSGSSQEDYDRFLEGPWYLQNDVRNMVVFAPDEGVIEFFDGDVQEIYRMSFFTRRGYRLSIVANNTSLHTIKKWIYITIKNPDTILISVSDGDLAEAEYRRLSPELQRTVLSGASPPAGPSDIAPAGIYRSTDGSEIGFDSPAFTWLEAAGAGRFGGFAVMAGLPLLNSHYLERELPERVDAISFKFLREDLLVQEDRTYMLEYREKSENSAVIRTMTLTPAELTIRGLLATSRDSLVLEQVEMVQ